VHISDQEKKKHQEKNHVGQRGGFSGKDNGTEEVGGWKSDQRPKIVSEACSRKGLWHDALDGGC